MKYQICQSKLRVNLSDQMTTESHFVINQLSLISNLLLLLKHNVLLADQLH